MDNYRLDEVASRYDDPAVDETRIEYEARTKDTIAKMEERIRKLEERINLMLVLKGKNIDISKFCFDLPPL